MTFFGEITDYIMRNTLWPFTMVSEIQRWRRA